MTWKGGFVNTTIGLDDKEGKTLETITRCKILEKVDRNTKYFHLIATTSRGGKLIDKLNVEGVLITKPKKIRKAMMGHYK